MTEFDRDPDENEKRVMVEALAHLTRVARRNRVCFACVVMNMADLVEDALEDGHIEHGIPGVHWHIPGSMQEH